MANTKTLNDFAAEWQDAEITLGGASKAPRKKYGEGVYEFSQVLTLSVLLPKRGWQVVKKGRSKIYLTPPTGDVKPFIITVKIPSEQQLRELFDFFIAEGKPWVGQLGEWPVFFIRQQNTVYYPENNKITGEILLGEGRPMEPTTWLRIGESGVWDAVIDMRKGDIAYFEHGTIKRL